MLLTLLAAAAMTTQPDSVPSAPPRAAAERADGRFVDGTHTGPAGSRAYKLYLPAGHEAAGGTPRPLLVVLHGCTQTPDDIARGTRFNALADAEGLLVLYPEQPASANAQRCWNWYDPAHQGRDAGEPAIVAAMTREVLARHGGDARRVYVTGISAGGALALTLAATHPDLFAAAAVHSAVPVGAAHDVGSALAAMRQGGAGSAEALLAAMGQRRRAVPLLVVHGSADVVVSPKNATAIVEQWSGAFGVEAQHGLEGDVPVALRLAMIPALGHAWSGGSADGTFTDPQGPDASRGVLRFLLAHTLPASSPHHDDDATRPTRP